MFDIVDPENSIDINVCIFYPTGRKWTHGLNFQSVMTPNGLIAYLSGPYEGKRHDSGIFRESNLAHNLSRHMNFTNGEPCCLISDAAYPSRALQGH